MKKRFIKITILLIFLATIIQLRGGLENLFRPSTVRAFGALTVDFHVPPGDPIFTSTNMAPGETVSRPIDVTNGASSSRVVAVKGEKTDGTGTSPLIESVLSIIILDGVTPVYGAGSITGPKTVADFFTDSSIPDSIMLGTLAPSDSKTYTLTVTFPPVSGNAFQAKSVEFDISFGTTDENVVINEVFYKVDNNHKKNKNKNASEQHTEWIELYNPTDQDINLKNWVFVDRVNRKTKIPNDAIIKAKGFAIVSESNYTWSLWDEDPAALKVPLGIHIGNGLDNVADRLILKNSNGDEIDRMAWGRNMGGFTPPGVNPAVPTGSSTQRVSTGFDTDRATDWEVNSPPTPGS